MGEGIVVALIGLLSVIISQLGNEVLKKFLNRTNEKAEENRDLRDEVREDNTDLRKENRRLANERDTWRMDYTILFEAYYRLRGYTYEVLTRNNIHDIVLPEPPQPRRENNEQE